MGYKYTNVKIPNSALISVLDSKHKKSAKHYFFAKTKGTNLRFLNRVPGFPNVKMSTCRTG